MRFNPLIPKTIKNLVRLVQETQKRNKEESSEEGYNKEAYFSKQGVRIIDPVFISMFYGLYITEELPPYPNEKYDLPDGISHDFGNAPIETHKEVFNNLLFCLWVYKYGLPENTLNNSEYRKNLYSFLDNILKDGYFLEVTVPFYLQKVSDSSFIQRLMESNYTENRSSPDNAPEFLALEFHKKQKKFLDKILNGFDIPDENFSALFEGEDQYTEYKESAFWSDKFSNEDIEKFLEQKESRELRDYGKDASIFIIAKTIAGFLNTKGGKLIIGILENKEGGDDKVVGIEQEYDKLHDPTPDGYRRKIVENIIRKYFETTIFNNFNEFFEINIKTYKEKTVCLIDVHPTKYPVFLQMKGKSPKFFVRIDGRTQELKDPKQIVEYCNERFEKTE